MHHTFIYCYYINDVADAAELLEPLERMEISKEGNNITFRCVGAGYPPPLVQWSKVNGSFSHRTSTISMATPTNEGNVTNVTVDLIFTRIHREDTGAYECSVSNVLNAVRRNATLIIQCMLLYGKFYSMKLCTLCFLYLTTIWHKILTRK